MMLIKRRSKAMDTKVLLHRLPDLDRVKIHFTAHLDVGEQVSGRLFSEPT